MNKDQNLVEMSREVSSFRKFSDLSLEDILKLPRLQMKISHQFNEHYQSDRFTAVVYFFDNQLEVRFPIDRASYFLIGKLRGKDTSRESYLISFPYRVVRGHGISEDDGHSFDYYYVEGYACPKEKKVYLNAVLKGSQVDLLLANGLDGIVDRGSSVTETMKESSYFDDLA